MCNFCVENDKVTNIIIVKLTLICLLIVITNNVKKYITRMGQKTGILKQSNIEQTRATSVDCVTEYQNLNSGSLLTNGRNSSLALVGNSGPPSSKIVNY